LLSKTGLDDTIPGLESATKR